MVRERLLEAELGRGRHTDVLPDIQALAREHPLRERGHELLMLALYRCGRQAEALDAYRATRATLVDELGIEPGPALQHLEQQILRQDAALLPQGAAPSLERAEPPAGVRSPDTLGAILVVPLSSRPWTSSSTSRGHLPRSRHASLLIVGTVSRADRLGALSRELEARSWGARGERRDRACRRVHLAGAGRRPGAAQREQAVDLALVDAPDDLLEDARVLALLEHAPCDVGVVAGLGQAGPRARAGPVCTVRRGRP